MSKASPPNQDNLRPEYDFASMKGGVRGKYVARLRKEGSNLVLLEPDIAKAFPSDAAVNKALRAVLKTLGTVREKRPARRIRSRAHKRKPARTARN